IGKDVAFTLLDAIADLPEETLRSGLMRLQSAEFVYETTLFPALEFTFKHMLTHDVAYGSLVSGRRRSLHARVVDALDPLHGAPPQRARRAPRPSRGPGGGGGEGDRPPPAGRREGLLARRKPGGRRVPRAGAPGARAPARGARQARAGHRHPARAATADAPAGAAARGSPALEGSRAARRGAGRRVALGSRVQLSRELSLPGRRA